MAKKKNTKTNMPKLFSFALNILRPIQTLLASAKKSFMAVKICVERGFFSRGARRCKKSKKNKIKEKNERKVHFNNTP